MVVEKFGVEKISQALAPEIFLPSIFLPNFSSFSRSAPRVCSARGFSADLTEQGEGYRSCKAVVVDDGGLG
jgi:hypothetical protein